jgi:hypothetical protein
LGRLTQIEITANFEAIACTPRGQCEWIYENGIDGDMRIAS